MNQKIIKLLPVEVTRAEAIQSAPASGPCLDFIASTACVDRYGEVIDPAGWKLDNYRRNPVFQNAHNYGDIVFTLGRALITEVRDIGEGRKGLYQKIEFATEANPIARIAHGLYAGGFLRAVSVGFVPIRWEDPDPSHERSTLSSQPCASNPAHACMSGGSTALCRRRYLEQELLEVSAVAVPANPEALALGLRSGHITPADLAAAATLLRTMSIKEQSPVWTFARQLHSLLHSQ